MARRMTSARQVPARRYVLGSLQALVMMCAAGLLSACGGTIPGAGPMDAMAAIPASARGAVAFESIDGAPPTVFERYVQVLDSEAQSRNVTVVSRSSAANYHVRSYLSAQVRGGRTSIAWVWDVYDANQQRVLRLTGEEDGGKSANRDAWSLADSGLLRRIAQSGLISLSGFVNGTAPPPAPGPDRSGPAVASLSDGTAEGGTTALGYSAQ